jgi:hypothetical protein
MHHANRYDSLAHFCPQCSCGCPELLIDYDAPAERRLVMTDDFGHRIEMSVEQFGEIVAQARSGALTQVLKAISPPLRLRGREIFTH